MKNRLNWFVGPLTAIAVCFGVISISVAQVPPLKPTQQGGEIARQLCTMIEAKNFLQRRITQQTGVDLINEYVKDLDPQKYYFYQADIARFEPLKASAAERIKAGDVMSGYQIATLFQQRAAEQMLLAHEFIDVEHDFTVDESIEVDGKDLPWATNTDDMKERWRKRIKYEFLTKRLEKKTDDEIRKELHKRYRAVADATKKMESDEVLELYLTSLCMTFDPHSTYMSPRTEEDFRISMNLKLEGIGAALNSEDGYTIVRQIVPGGAASKDGRLKVGDKITAVGAATGDMVDVVEMKTTKVVQLIRGPRGTKVRLQVLTAAGNESKLYELVRETVELKQSEVKGEIIDTAKRLNLPNGPRIGIINIPSFYRDFQGAEDGDAEFKSTSRDVNRVIEEFTAQGGVDAVIVDLRWNGGGALAEAIEVSGLFVKQGPVVQVKDQRGKVRALTDDEPEIAYRGPLLVVCNRLSASASEIFAGVIKDFGRGIIVGDRTTHGKGTVQSVMEVGKQILPIFDSPSQGSLKLTIQQFYRANGDSTQNLGVPSDVVLPSLIDHMDLGEQFLDHAMPFDKVAEVPHDRYNRVNSEIVASLRERSTKRIGASPEFQKIVRDIARYLDRKQRKTISLNEQTLRAERIEAEEKSKEKVETAEDGTDGPIFAVDPYNDELLQISADYISVLRDLKTAKK